MNESNPPSILILGGSGFVGRSVCERLVRHFGGAARITVPTRRLSHAQAVRPLPGVTVLQADVHQDAELQRLLAGQDIVINLIAILQGSEAAFERAHVALPRRLAAACRASGVRRLIHLSAIGAAPDAPSRYLRSKGRGEQVLRQEAGLGVCAAEGVESENWPQRGQFSPDLQPHSQAMGQEAGEKWTAAVSLQPTLLLPRRLLELTVLRPSVIFGQGDRFLNLFARLQALAPLLPLAGAKASFQPVWVEDVAEAVLRCALDRDTLGQTFELAGPQVASLAALARQAGAVAGHARPILPLPGPVAWLQALFMEMLPGEPLLSRDNLASMRVPNVASGTLPGLETLGIKPQSVAAVLPGYLAPGSGCARLNRWRASARRG